eukprot:jgi/Tetstr1/457865/TSEL_004267.t1
MRRMPAPFNRVERHPDFPFCAAPHAYIAAPRRVRFQFASHNTTYPTVTSSARRGTQQVERRLRKCRVGTNWLTSLAGLTIGQLRTWDGFSDWHKVDEQHNNSKSVRDFLITDLLLITKIAYLHGIPKSARHKYRGFWIVVADTQSIAI